MTRAHRTFVSYIDKSRKYYAAQGYDAPYRWATHDESPFTPLTKPLADCRVGVVTTAALRADDPLDPYVAPSMPQPSSMATEHLFWHKDATHTNDVGSFLPLDHLHALVSEGVIGSVAPRFAGIRTVYSHRRTNKWAEQIRLWFEADEVDLAILIPL